MVKRLSLYRHCEALKTRSNVVTLFIHDKKVERHCEALKRHIKTRSNVVTLFIHDYKKC